MFLLCHDRTARAHVRRVVGATLDGEFRFGGRRFHHQLVTLEAGAGDDLERGLVRENLRQSGGCTQDVAFDYVFLAIIFSHAGVAVEAGC